MVPWLERNQIACYLAAILAGLLIDAPVLQGLVTPVLGFLLFVTFLSVPLTRVRINARFLTVLALLNAAIVPVVAGLLALPLRDDTVVHAAVLLVLLAPCIDYVIAFTGLAGGARAQLLAATPLLLIGQLLLLPPLLRLFVGSQEALPAGPFLEAFLLLILLPLGAAFLLQRLMPRRRWARRIDAAGNAAMVPLMMATLFVVLAGHAGGVLEQWQRLLLPAGIYLLFALVMIVAGLTVSSLLRLPAPQQVAATFSGVTRNSLVVLPFALAMGGPLAPVVVVTQTMVELVIMVVMVGAMPRIVRRMSG
ncbi:arsenic resistance protein [Corynebacterium sp. YIM 101645]|uniref:Arsenic resistance protein n=1 Tax=Corynebacterium lemuris TaxID=1859292 RepID=A0ABT2G430_9CORY|nr:arsenic resistance protein [Corynebacterium lemuris]MCS5480934.1 arsenic resistance protein [Corynebacterium lemuris]